MNDLLIVLMVFIASVLLFWSVYLIWKERYGQAGDRVKERVGQLSNAFAEPHSDSTQSLARQQLVSPMDRFLLTMPGGPRLDRFLERAGVNYGPSGVLMRVTLGALIGGALAPFLFPQSALLALIVGLVVGAMLPVIRLRRLRRLRRARLVSQLPDAMDFFARSLRAGNPLIGALRSAPDELPQPIAGELEITFDEMNYGLDFEEVMRNLSDRIDAEEIRFFVTAVLVQKTTGGNLAEIMTRISTLLRERIKTRGEVMVQAAEMKASAHVLIALPFFLAGVLQLLNPSYFLILLDSPMGHSIIIAQLVLMFIGYLVMRRMVNFRI